MTGPACKALCCGDNEAGREGGESNREVMARQTILCLRPDPSPQPQRHPPYSVSQRRAESPAYTHTEFLGMLFRQVTTALDVRYCRHGNRIRD
jgi:hypothetical protein